MWEPFPGRDGHASSQQITIDTRCNDTLLTGTRGGGKMQPLDSKILSYTGWIRMGDVKVGTRVLTPSGRQSTITHIYEHSQKQIYKMQLLMF